MGKNDKNNNAKKPAAPQGNYGDPATLLDEATKARRRLNCPLRAEVKGRDVAEAVAFFASSASGNVTGERLVVDGGCTCQHMPEDVDV